MDFYNRLQISLAKNSMLILAKDSVTYTPNSKKVVLLIKL